MHDVAILRGDGIGPEISEAAQRVLESAGARIRWHDVPAGASAAAATGNALPWSTLETLRKLRVGLKAPLVAERCSGGVRVEGPDGGRSHPSVNNGLRRELGLFVNVRPVRGWSGISGAYSQMDLVILREITEDVYSGLERTLPDGSAEAIKRVTPSACRRIAEYAVDYARRHHRSTISAIHKANVLHQTDGLFLKTVREVVGGCADLYFDEAAIDAACYLLVKAPQRFDVMVAGNQYGDIISDLAAGLAGSLGLAPGANIGEEIGVFEAAHGAAPDIAGHDVANPISLILSGAMLLDYIGQGAAAEQVRDTVGRVLEDGRYLTRDLGGACGTREFTAVLCSAMQEA